MDAGNVLALRLGRGLPSGAPGYPITCRVVCNVRFAIPWRGRYDRDANGTRRWRANPVPLDGPSRQASRVPYSKVVADMVQNGILLCAALLIPSLSACSNGPPSKTPKPDISLEEAFSQPLPNDFAVSGLSVSQDGMIVLWSANAPRLATLDPVRLRLAYYSLGDSPGFVAAARVVVGDAPGLEVVSGIRLLSADTLGQKLRSVSINAPVEVTAAVRGRVAWYFAGISPDQRLRIYRRVNGGNAEEIVSREDWRRGATSPPPDVLLGIDVHEGQERLIVGLPTYPFTTEIVSADGDAVMHFETPQKALEAAQMPKGALWQAVGLVPFDDGFIQTLSDLRSDARLLVEYDRAGRVVGTALAYVPIGFAGSLRRGGESILIGLRRLNVAEVVGFRVVR